jgi:hypothetical protein
MWVASDTASERPTPEGMGGYNGLLACDGGVRDALTALKLCSARSTRPSTLSELLPTSMGPAVSMHADGTRHHRAGALSATVSC